MKKSIFLFLAFSFFMQISFAQTLSEKLGGATTNFQITHNDNEVVVISQTIVPRGRAVYNNLDEYAYGNQMLVLELILKKKIEEEEIIVEQVSEGRRVAKMIFYAEDGSILFEKYPRKKTGTYEKKPSDIELIFEKIGIGGSEEDKLYFYTINLKNYPIALLEKTTRIEFLAAYQVTKNGVYMYKEKKKS